MKKSLFLLMFVCMSVGFNAYGAENIDPTIVADDDLIQFNRCVVSGDDEWHLPTNGRVAYKYHESVSVGNGHHVTTSRCFLPDAAGARYIQVIEDDYNEDVTPIIQYCDKDGVNLYGHVFDNNGDIQDPVVPILKVPEQDDVNDPQDAGNAQDNNKGNADNDTPKSWGMRKPLIIVGVSAAAAGSAYAITKFVNKRWNKQYNAKKVAAFSGIGAGIITGVYLYWPTAEVANQ